MYTISVETRFTASHQLTLVDGSKEPLHRHSWAATADVSSASLNDLGLVMDFNRLKEMVDNIVADFDDSCLEDLDYFQKKNSSAENMAKYIYERLALKLPTSLNLDSITVVEQPNCSARFTGSPGDW
jgi:6-pyruvoyltetrahydropterin/6-carboxytetrahydropterin synthase